MPRLIKLQAVHKLVGELEEIMNNHPDVKFDSKVILDCLGQLQVRIDKEWHKEMENYFVSQEEEEYDAD